MTAPARRYSWPAFAPGHATRLEHGLWHGPTLDAQVDQLIADGALPTVEETLEACAHLSVLDGHAIAGWRRGEAAALIAWSLLLAAADAAQRATEAETIEATSAALDRAWARWDRAEGRARSARKDIALDLASRTALVRDAAAAGHLGALDAVAAAGRAARQAREQAATSDGASLPAAAAETVTEQAENSG
ncbi:MAG: hypothetical protein ACYDH6_08635 [Acidimicrobiales bacterium]